MPSSNDNEIDSLLAQVDQVGKSLRSGKDDAPTRTKLRLAARQLSLALEEPGDIVDRVCFQFMETASIRIAINLGLFSILVKQDQPQTCNELAAATGADPVLLGRILRSLGSIGAIGEVGDIGKEAYVPTKVSRTFVVPKLAAGVEFCFDILSPCWNKLPAYLAERKYQNPTNVMDTAFHKAFHSKEHFMQFMGSKPDSHKSAQLYMSGMYEGKPTWLDFFPVMKQISEGAHERKCAVTFVDLGGGYGQEAVTLRKRFPSLPGRIVLQDLPQVASGLGLEGVEVMVHDMFSPQPLKGARVYFLRNVLHDWNDDLCQKILERIREAMAPDYSKLLINQWLVPTQQASPLMTHQDLNMMSLLSAVERTEPQWRELLDSAGFEIAHVWRPEDPKTECIIEAVPK